MDREENTTIIDHYLHVLMLPREGDSVIELSTSEHGRNITIIDHNLLMPPSKRNKVLEPNTSADGRKCHNHRSQPTYPAKWLQNFWAQKMRIWEKMSQSRITVHVFNQEKVKQCSRTPDQDFSCFYRCEITLSHTPIPARGRDKKRTVRWPHAYPRRHCNVKMTSPRQISAYLGIFGSFFSCFSKKE